MRLVEVSTEQRRNEGVGKNGDPEKTRRPVASSGTIPTCDGGLAVSNSPFIANPIFFPSFPVNDVPDSIPGGPLTRGPRWRSGERTRLPVGSFPDFHTWESCRAMMLAGGLSRECSVSPALAFQCCSISIWFHTLFGSFQVLVVKISANFATPLAAGELGHNPDVGLVVLQFSPVSSKEKSPRNAYNNLNAPP
ncbi:hypothetical protein PR048_014677, partial [Dryococelus australis]